MRGRKSIREKTIRVHRYRARGLEIEDVDLRSAKRILQEAHVQGWLVINKKTAELIDELDPNVEEILIIGMLEGG